MDGKKKKVVKKKKKKGKVRSKVADPRFSELEKVVLLTKIAGIQKALEVKLKLKATLEEETEIYDKLCNEEIQEKKECAAILQKVIAEAELANEMYEMDFQRWMKNRYLTLQQCEMKLEEVRLRCEEQVRQKQTEKANSDEALEMLKTMETKKSPDLEELNRKEIRIQLGQLQFIERKRTADENFMKEFIRIGQDLKWRLREAAEVNRKEASSKESWLKDVIEETSRIELYLKEFELKTQFLRENYPLIRARIESLKDQIEVKKPILQKIVTTVRKRRDIIYAVRTELKDMSSHSDQIVSLNAEQKILKSVVRNLEAKIRDISNRCGEKEKSYKELLTKKQILTTNPVHRAFEEISKQLAKAADMMASALSRVLDATGHFGQKHEKYILPLLMFLDTSLAPEYESDKINQQITVLKQLEENGYSLGKLGLIGR